MDIINGIKILYSEKLNNDQEQEYLNIIKSVLSDIQEHKDIVIDSNILMIIRMIDAQDWKDDKYNGIFYHSSLIIEVKIDKNKERKRELLNFREVLYHELNHVIFQHNMFINNNKYIYNKQSEGIVYINEYLAYYNTYKYMLTYAKNVYKMCLFKEYKEECREDIKSICDKYKNKEDGNKVSSSDLKKLINSVARKIALKEFNLIKYQPVLSIEICESELPKDINFKNISKMIGKYDENVKKYIKEIVH